MDNEIFDEFQSAPSIPTPYIQPSSTLTQLSQNTNNFLIDNNILYKKLLEIEYELSIIKAIVNTISNTQPIYYPSKPLELQTPIQMIPQQQGNIPQVWTTPTNTIWKNNQTQFK